MYFSVYVDRKVPKERHLRETPTVSPLRIPLPHVRPISLNREMERRFTVAV
jgi:hypothetical protein